MRRATIIGGSILIGAPAAQWAAERFSGLPVGPARMLVIALCLGALIPVTVDAVERVWGRPLARAGRRLLAVAVPLIALWVLLAAARLGDGPWGPVPGGPLRGRVTTAEPDWTRVDALQYLELEISGGDRRSLETLVIRDGTELYVGANYPHMKRWPRDVQRAPDVVVRIDGLLYPRRAVRVGDPARLAALLGIMSAKYGFDVSLGTGVVRFFRLDRP